MPLLAAKMPASVSLREGPNNETSPRRNRCSFTLFLQTQNTTYYLTIESASLLATHSAMHIPLPQDKPCRCAHKTAPHNHCPLCKYAVTPKSREWTAHYRSHQPKPWILKGDQWESLPPVRGVDSPQLYDCDTVEVRYGDWSVIVYLCKQRCVGGLPCHRHCPWCDEPVRHKKHHLERHLQSHLIRTSFTALPGVVLNKRRTLWMIRSTAKGAAYPTHVNLEEQLHSRCHMKECQYRVNGAFKL